MRKISMLAACLVAFASPAQASWLYCKFSPANCTYIQGSLIPFDEAEIIIEDCRSLTRGNVGAAAMSMSVDRVMSMSNGNISHPLLMAQLAYNSLHDSALKFDRSTPIERRYAHVQRACAQAFADWNRE
ncbi:MAG: hypothetical protein RBT67_02830 [Thauera sp.]|jgi:hypothetical protein|nr:hypothetical protein [Thauera sp.]